MKITIDITEFYLDEEQDIESALKKFIINDVVCKINEDLKKKIHEQISLEAKRLVEELLYKKVSLIVKDLIATEQIRSRYDSSKMVSLQDWIMEEYKNTKSINTMGELVKQQADKIMTELKNRYDLLFASQIVLKMKENDLVNKDVADKLLEGSNGKN